eukprot:153394-Rhodomonas_salina.1
MHTVWPRRRIQFGERERDVTGDMESYRPGPEAEGAESVLHARAHGARAHGQPTPQAGAVTHSVQSRDADTKAWRLRLT